MDDLVSPALSPAKLTDRVPPHVYFIISAFFHYLGPAFAVLLFARVEPLGVAWLRIATRGYYICTLAEAVAVLYFA